MSSACEWVCLEDSQLTWARKRELVQSKFVLWRSPLPSYLEETHDINNVVLNIMINMTRCNRGFARNRLIIYHADKHNIGRIHVFGSEVFKIHR